MISVVLSALSLLFVYSPFVHSFFNEIALLRDELAAWQETSTADLSSVVERLEQISGPDFSDVSQDDWFYPYVTSVAQWGIVSGYRNSTGELSGTYGPNDPVTIAQAVKMALKASQIDETQCQRPAVIYKDASAHWAVSGKFISCAEEIGMRLLQFAPDLDRTATRAEVLSIINDAWGDPIPPLYSTFKDTADHPLEADIALAAARGIITGDTDEEGNMLFIFRPDDEINRAEVAKLLYERVRAQTREELAVAAEGVGS